MTLRQEFRDDVVKAHARALKALLHAQAHGWRTDCLEVAVRSLKGTLSNIDFEDAEQETS